MKTKTISYTVTEEIRVDGRTVRIRRSIDGKEYATERDRRLTVAEDAIAPKGG